MADVRHRVVIRTGRALLFPRGGRRTVSPSVDFSGTLGPETADIGDIEVHDVWRKVFLPRLRRGETIF